MFSFKKKWNTVSQSDDRHSTIEEESNSSFSEFNSTFDHASPSPQQQQQQQQQSSTDYSSIRVFEMESDHDLPAIITNIPSPSVSSTSSHSTVRQSSSKPIDIKYFVPRNTEPEGLSQSVMISDHDYIHRQLLKRYQMSYDEHESLPHNSLAENNMECSHDDDSHYSSESHVNNFFSDDRSSAKMVTSLLSKSVPLLSSMSSYHKFAWSKLTPPNQDYLPSELPCPNEKYQKESNVDAGVVTVKGNRNTLESNDIDEEPDSNSLEEWINAANQRFGKITVEEKKDLEKRLGAVFSKTPWDRAHEDPCTLERLKQNPFIHILFQRYSVPMKVTNIARNARFKQIQYHFHNPSVLYMRYIRNTQTVFVIYRCYAEMIKAVRVMDSTGQDKDQEAKEQKASSSQQEAAISPNQQRRHLPDTKAPQC
ncbi:hypothetical protein [Parasitella parasitica]|uniref:Uncharacterized protein n=1 Tax=Parasitella parasitica TaxID=35722 RepID=A0A0B7MVU1_9FUNG|nr:hypothetical protein [Parasitella parasitica]